MRSSQKAAAIAAALTAPMSRRLGVDSITIETHEAAYEQHERELRASGKHIANAVLTSRAKRFELTDIMITSCAFTGDLRKHEFTGHVTLMK